MFFSISRNCDPRFPCQHRLGRLILNTDQGWQTLDFGTRKIIFKGYAEDFVLVNRVESIADHEHRGNFCVFDHDAASGITKVKTNRDRAFTAWIHDQGITNFESSERAVWADSELMIDQDLAVHEVKFDAIGSVLTQTISRADLVQQIHDRLHQRIANFLAHNQLPVKIFVSGGIDSMLVYSYIKQLTDQYQMVFMNHVEWDEFWCRNQHYLTSRFWGYRQIHHWLSPTVLSSGAPGDEFMLRSPTTANLWLQSFGTSILEQLENHAGGQCLHADYFHKPAHRTLFAEQALICDDYYNDREKFFWNLCNILVNDQQHWHLGHTLTFTPLRDLEIAKLFLRLDLKDGIAQILNSEISLELITKNDPTLAEFLSDHKNSGEVLANLPGLMSRYSATSGQ